MPEPASADGIVADFYSDTRSKPTRAMLETMLSAEVGDVQSGEDATTNRLCERVTQLLGKEAAVFLPSGTMCNEIALRVHCEPGSEVICDRSSHIINFEAGGPAALSGVMLRALDGEHGRFTADQVRAAYRTRSRYSPESRLVSVEQTTNMGGGGIWPLATLRDVAQTAKELGLATHMDGARLFNACVASGVPAKDYVAAYDTCWIDFTKGLGGFAGAVLAGPKNFIDHAWRFMQQWGGALRQSGVVAATGLYALDHHVERLADDHRLAATIGARLTEMQNVRSVLPCETNIVIFSIDEAGPTAATVVQRLLRKGVRVGAFGERTIRIVTHLGVDQEHTELLCGHLPDALA
jgi:threonine aldolase